MSIVYELQQAALDESTPVSTLLRRTLVVASKLDKRDSVHWVQQELTGYRPETIETELPTYRIVRCRIMSHNPYHGWQPLQYRNSKDADKLEWARLYIAVPEIETWVAQKNESSGSIGMELPAEVVQELCRVTGTRTQFIRDISPSSFVNILSAVRNLVLQWTLTLECDGIQGDQPTSIEKQKAVDVPVPGITISGISGSNNNVTILQGGAESSQALTPTTVAAADSKSKSGGWFPELLLKTVKAVPQKWIFIALSSAVTLGSGAYAWVKGWIQTWPW